MVPIDFFETMYCHDYSIPMWIYHRRRIERTFSYFLCSPKDDTYYDTMWQKIQIQLIAQKSTTLKIKIVFTKDQNDYNYHINCEEVATDIFCNTNIYQSLTLYVQELLQKSATSFIKKTDRTLYIHSLNYALQQGVDQSIVLNQEQQIVETSYCTIYIIKGNSIMTPPITAACIQGVFRDFIIESIQNKLLNIPLSIEEKLLYYEDIASCDELFMTSALRGIVLCDRLDQIQFDTTKSSILSQKCKTLLLKNAF